LSKTRFQVHTHNLGRRGHLFHRRCFPVVAGVFPPAETD
jgi:hypothetical protein